MLNLGLQASEFAEKLHLHETCFEVARQAAQEQWPHDLCPVNRFSSQDQIP